MCASLKIVNPTAGSKRAAPQRPWTVLGLNIHLYSYIFI